MDEHDKSSYEYNWKESEKIQLKESKDYKRNYMNQRLKVYKLYKIRYLIIIHHQLSCVCFR